MWISALCYNPDMQSIWDEFKWWIVGVPAAVTIVILIGGVWRVTHGRPFLYRESSQHRQNRLMRCAEVYGTMPTGQQRLSGDDAGVCSGFEQSEIQAYIDKEHLE